MLDKSVLLKALKTAICYICVVQKLRIMHAQNLLHTAVEVSAGTLVLSMLPFQNQLNLELYRTWTTSVVLDGVLGAFLACTFGTVKRYIFVKEI